MASPVLFVALGLLGAVSTTPPPFELYLEQNNIYGALTNPGQSIGSVRYLGKMDSPKECFLACMRLTDAKCFSFTYHTDRYVGDYQRQCYGVVDDPMWSPMPQEHVDSGLILWPCKSSMDCSLNGKCMSNGRCSCDKAWSGPRCGELNLMPADIKSGYHFQEHGREISSWGGAVLRDDKDGSYHMYLAEMRNHCGINSWTLNSQLVHAVSKTPDGMYERREVLRTPFAHEPDAIRGNNGEYIIMWSENHYAMPLCNCTDGSTDPHCKLPQAMFQQYLSYAMTPNGPWSPPMKLFGGLRGTDTNFAAVILPNGTLIGFTRYGSGKAPFTGSRMHLVTASDWKKPSTYIEHPGDVFPKIPANGVEDPFLYRDKSGNFHAIFHNMYPANDQSRCGAHAFSKDGLTWTFGGKAFENKVKFTDGREFTFTRRERPHFIFAADGYTPIALTNGAQYGGKYGDATYTLLQPVYP